MVDVAFILNEPTPYRLHFLRRLTAELPAVRVHPIFTHTLANTSAPWEMSGLGALGAVHHADLAVVPGQLAPRRSAALTERIGRYLLDHDVRLVILHGYGDLARIGLIRWARDHGLPLVVRADSNVNAEGRLSGPRALVKRLFIRWLLRNVSGLMPMGRCGRAFFRHYADHDLPVFLVPYEPDYAQFAAPGAADRDAFLAAHGLAPDRRRILCCGRLVAHKRPGAVLEAFVRHVADEREAWDLVYAGDGPERESLQRRVPGALAHRVQFLGFLQSGELPGCYRACEVLAHPSAYEPWGVVINEAVANGLAVVASEVCGAAAELVIEGENGRVLTSARPADLGAALLDVTQPSTLARMREAAPAALARWRRVADPVAGVAAAVRYFTGDSNSAPS